MITYSYNDIEEIAKKVAKEINFDYKGANPSIITFTKGGTFASSFISKYLIWKPTIISIGDLFPGTLFEAQDGYIVIDDILDTGKTAKNLDDELLGYSYDNLFYYFLVYKHTDRNIWKPKYSYAQEVVKDDWVVFPWETYETSR